MIRFLLILLLAAVALKQALPGLLSKTNLNSAELSSICDETESEKTDKTESKNQPEDKLHYYDLHFSANLSASKGNLAPGAEHLYKRFCDQPGTPPPNLG